jgi:tRNA modification GTPase
MFTNSDQDTIAAIATPLGSGAIGIIRISGKKAWPVADRIFFPAGRWQSNDNLPTSHQLMYGYIREPELGHIIDEVLLVLMRAPRSYTREDVVEIQSHSGPAILRKILGLILQQGTRLAEAGEFTKRAFLNGRIDLSQAESVAELISARTDTAMHSAAVQISGEMKDSVSGWIRIVKNALVELEAGIEFCDDIEQQIDAKTLEKELSNKILDPIKGYIDQYESGHVLRDGVRLDIVGRPNVGKSSLLNRLLKKEKAIVSPIPGTTRDLVEDFFSIRGIPINITDTAGLHRSEDPIETIGIKKTKENIAQSNLILCIIDASKPFNEEDQDIFKTLVGKDTILVVNKIDLVKEKKDITLPDQWRSVGTVFLSALTGEGLETLKDTIADVCLGEIHFEPGKMLIPSVRQKNILEVALKELKNVIEGLNAGYGDEIIAEGLEHTMSALQQITGEGHDELIMDQIFERFCIGK